MLELTKVAETSTTLTLRWTPPADVGGYVLYANDQPSTASARIKATGELRNEAKFHKTSPGPPFSVCGVCRSTQGAIRLEVGTYVPGSRMVFPSTTLFPREGA